MRILLTGGTGFIGRHLVSHLTAAGHECTLLVRRLPSEEGPRCVLYEDLASVEPAEAVVNLAGELAVGRWTQEKKRRILDSRIGTTRRLVEWMATRDPKPRVFLSASAVGIYGHRPGEALTEASPLDRERKFRYQVCEAWEQAAGGAEALGTRTVCLRIGNVLDGSGGVIGLLRPWLRPAPFFMPFAPHSMNPWVALPDVIRLVEFALDQEEVAGPLNVVAPQSVTLRELTQALGDAMGKPVLGRLPDGLVRLAFGEFSEALLDSQDVRPDKALRHGFRFEHEDVGRFLSETMGRSPSEPGPRAPRA